MVEGGSQMFRPGTVSLVEPDDMKPGIPGLVGNPSHVMGIMATFQAMNQNQSRAMGTLWLPMTQGENLRVGIDLKETLFFLNIPEQMATWVVSWQKGLNMRIGKPSGGGKGWV